MEHANDYSHALRDIRRRLHDQRGSKAAVLVGAGFSRNAVSRSGDGRKLPLWPDLTAGMAERLYPEEGDRKLVLKNAGATSSALRLAQEFEVAFGRPALVEFVRNAIRDDEFLPGELHQMLLDLNWTDVFTTNYDRLLESKARTLLNRRYEPVLNLADLPIACRPRIVKLHGSMSDLCDMVLTEEDFRRYPRDYSPFVTAVQASLTENVLCLIGFSGDDPNFLAWTGWLRDELGSSVPKTYLFTGKDELKPFQRRLLEERNIIPIPLFTLSNKKDHGDAYRWLFDELSMPPGDPTPSWNVAPDTESRVIAKEPYSTRDSTWLDAVMLWRRHRLQYQDWQVLHQDGADRLLFWTEWWMSDLAVVSADEWSPPKAIFVLRELIWRWSSAYMPLQDDLVEKIIYPQLRRFAEWRAVRNGDTVTIAGGDEPLVLNFNEIQEAYIFLLQECIRHARETANEERFDELLVQLDELIRQEPIDAPDVRAFIKHQQILLSLGRLGQSSARALLLAWDTSHCDLIWGIRRAGLSLEVGLQDLARNLLTDALEGLRESPISDRINYHRLSTEGLILRLLWIVRWLEESEGRQRSDRHLENSSDQSVSQPVRKPSTYAAVPKKDQEDPHNKDTNDEPPATAAILNRLRELRQHGCDIRVLEEVWAGSLPDEPRRTKGAYEVEGFQIGHMHRTVSSGSEKDIQLAYRALRFIEDSGLPLFAELSNAWSRLSVAKDLFIKATNIVAYFVPREACGIVFRSLDEKTIKNFLSRQCLAELEQPQVGTLFDAAEQALDEALTNFEPGTSDQSATSGFWEKQFEIACNALSHLMVRMDDATVSQLASKLVPLTVNARLEPHPRWRCQRALATCVQQLGECLRRSDFEKLLPAVLDSSVPGEPAFPGRQVTPDQWEDFSTVADRFKWDSRSKATRAVREKVDDVIERLELANGRSREHLSLRLVYLHDAGILTSGQQKAFRDALFVACDDYGFPTGTGCIDSLVLALPRKTDFDEREAFRQKHLSSDEIEKIDWRTLHQTMSPLPDDRRRQISWTQSDLERILDLSKDWLRKAIASQHEGAKKDRLRFSDLWGGKESIVEALPNWQLCLENLILLNPKASPELRQSASQLLADAEVADFCVALTVASRTIAGLVTEEAAINSILLAIRNQNAVDVIQGCQGIQTWAILSNSGDVSMPSRLTDTLTAVLASRRHEHTAQLVNTIRVVFKFLGPAEQETLVSKIEPSLRVLLEETKYSSRDRLSPERGFSIGVKLSVRTACARLFREIRAVGFDLPVLNDWESAISNDLFADVRRVADG